MKKLFVALVFAMSLISCGDDMMMPPTTANIIVVEPKESGSGYKIMMDGYGMNWWRLKDIVVKVDQSVPKGEPKAEFLLKADGKPNDLNTITVYFSSMNEAREALSNKSITINGE